jgi:hypothetical protein
MTEDAGKFGLGLVAGGGGGGGAAGAGAGASGADAGGGATAASAVEAAVASRPTTAVARTAVVARRMLLFGVAALGPARCSMAIEDGCSVAVERS